MSTEDVGSATEVGRVRVASSTCGGMAGGSDSGIAEIKKVKQKMFLALIKKMNRLIFVKRCNIRKERKKIKNKKNNINEIMVDLALWGMPCRTL